MPSKLTFDSVLLEFEAQRPAAAAAGFAWAQTSRFAKKGGYLVELDVATGLVHITHEKGGAAIVVPIGRVKQFEPLPAAESAK